MFKPTESPTINDIRNSRSLKELDSIISRIGQNVKTKKSKLRSLFKKLSKVFKFGLSTSAKDETIEVGRNTGGMKPNRVSGSPTAYLKDYDHPKDTKSLAASLAHIEEFFQLAYELEVAEMTLSRKYSGLEKSKQKALKAVQEHIDEVSDSLNEAFRLLNKASEKIRKDHAPREVSDWARGLYNHLVKTLDKSSYSGIMEPVLYASIGKDGSINYQFFIEVEGVIDTSGFEFEEYWFVLTANINDKGALNYYLVTLDGFETPGTFNPGRQVRNRSDMLRRSVALLNTDKVVSHLEKKPMPVGTRDVKRSGVSKIKGIKNVKIMNNALYVFLTKSVTAKQINEILNEIIPQLKIIMGVRETSSKVMHNVEKTRNGQKVIKFVLTPRFVSKDDHVTVQQFDQLSDQMNLSPKMAREFRKVLLKY